MRILKQAMAVLGTVTMIVVVMAVVAPKTARSTVAALVQIIPGSTTHVGQNESQLVNLLCIRGNSFCNSVSSSGAIAGGAYVVPSGSTLIITDYSWEKFLSSAGFLSTDCLTNTTVFGACINISTSTTLADRDGATGGHEHYSTGLRVASGVTLLDQNVAFGAGFASVQGYLVPND